MNRPSKGVSLVVIDDRQPEEQEGLVVSWKELNDRVANARRDFAAQVRSVRPRGWTVLASSWVRWWPTRPLVEELEDAL